MKTWKQLNLEKKGFSSHGFFFFFFYTHPSGGVLQRCNGDTFLCMYKSAVMYVDHTTFISQEITANALRTAQWKRLQIAR